MSKSWYILFISSFELYANELKSYLHVVYVRSTIFICIMTKIIFNYHVLIEFATRYIQNISIRYLTAFRCYQRAVKKEEISLQKKRFLREQASCFEALNNLA